MAKIKIGTFYGYSNGSAYGQYTCYLEYTNITRSGSVLTMHNANLNMVRYSTKYTTNRFALKAGIGGSTTNLANNATIKAYNVISEAEINYSLGSPTITTNNTSFAMSFEIASTGGSSEWGNFQSTNLKQNITITGAPPAAPIYSQAPKITNIEETTLRIDRGTVNISSNFYYAYEKTSASGTLNWIQQTDQSIAISNLDEDTEYDFYFKAIGTATNLEAEWGKLTIKTYPYPSISNIIESVIEVGATQTIELNNPLGREVQIIMENASLNSGVYIFKDDDKEKGFTKGTSFSFVVPAETASLAIGALNTSGTAVYYCKYGEQEISNYISGGYSITETLAKPVWPLDIDVNSLILYKDGNPTSVALTGKESTLIQKYSQLYYGINYSGDNAAISNYNSTISHYEVSINGENYFSISEPQSEPNTNANHTVGEKANYITIAVRAVDTRGFKTNSLIRTISVSSFFNPFGTIDVFREGGYGEIISLTIFPVWGIGESNAGTATYTYKKSGAVIATVTGVTTFEEPILIEDCDNDSIYSFEIILIDSLGNVSETIYGTVGIGEPILFIDSEQVGVGINCFPEGKGLYVKGNSEFSDDVNFKSDITINGNENVKGYLVVGAHRRQQLIRNNEQRTGWFWTGGTN